jgi:hypothetical protein
MPQMQVPHTEWSVEMKNERRKNACPTVENKKPMNLVPNLSIKREKSRLPTKLQ